MAEWNAVATLVTPAGTVTFNATTGDTFWDEPDKCAGLDMAPLRTPIEDRPQTDGGIVHPFLAGPRHVTKGGQLRVRSASDETGYITARNGLEDDLVAALESIRRADGTYSWTPTGGSSRSLTVRCDVPVIFSGGVAGAQKSYLFGLVAADPAFA